MNALDLLAAIIVVLGAVLGYRVGAIRQLGGLIGALLGVALVLVLAFFLVDYLSAFDALARTTISLVALGIAASAGQQVGSMLGARIADGEPARPEQTRLASVTGAANRGVGAIVGGLEALIIVWLVGSLIAIAPDPTLARLAQKSATLQTLQQIAPPPETLAQTFSDSLAGSGLAQLFDGIAPSPVAPTDLPNDAKVRAIAEAAAASTVKIISSGCAGRQSVGSGVVVSPEYVATNAHVIAGGTYLQVETQGRRYEATAVRVDSQLDAALLHVPGLSAPSLFWAVSNPERGDKAAVLGYPGGGPFTAERASVSRQIAATGRSLSGAGSVTRDVLEIRAKVEPGNSGGPLVLSNGRIGGLVFAESPSDPGIGYALAADDVRGSLMPAVGSTQSVSTGSCQS